MAEVPGNAAKVPFDVGQCATMACLLDIAIPKPGNVHRGADFADATFLDFAVSAVAIAPAMARGASQPVGETIFQAIQATREVVQTNTNLGIVLLLAPLAAVPPEVAPIRTGIADRLQALTPHDSQLIYDAVRLAEPGGLGSSSQMDVRHDAAPPSILDAMRWAADRDSVARQYARNFSDLWESICPRLDESCQAWGLPLGIIDTYVATLAEMPDSLIGRKLGFEAARAASARAAAVRDAGRPDSAAYRQALSDLDFWLRSDGNRRNPGTTADLVTAALFVGLREGWLRIRDAARAIQRP